MYIEYIINNGALSSEFYKPSNKNNTKYLKKK